VSAVGADERGSVVQAIERGRAADVSERVGVAGASGRAEHGRVSVAARSACASTRVPA